MSQTAPTDAGGSRTRSVLEEEREFFLRSLRDLEAERAAGDIDEHDYVALRDDYTARAAEVLRRLEDLDAGPAGAPAAPAAPAVGGADAAYAPAVPVGGGADASAAQGDGTAGASATPDAGPGHEVAAPAGGGADAPAVPGGGAEPSQGAGDETPATWPGWRAVLGHRRSPARRAVIATAVVLVLGGLVWAVAGAAGARLPGENVSGSNPGDTSTVDSLLVKAQDAIGDSQPLQAVKDYESALKIDPSNAVALTGEGAIFVQTGVEGHDTSALDYGLQKLASAEIADPSYSPAYGWRGLGLLDAGDTKAAISQLRAYVADTPKASRSPAMVQALAKAQAAEARAKS